MKTKNDVFDEIDAAELTLTVTVSKKRGGFTARGYLIAGDGSVTEEPEVVDFDNGVILLKLESGNRDTVIKKMFSVATNNEK